MTELEGLAEGQKIISGQINKLVVDHRERDLYAAYANHCAIQKKVPMTWHSWKRAQRVTEGHTKEGM